MAEYAKITFDNKMFYNVKNVPDMCILKNDSGNIELLGNSEEIVNEIYDILTSSSRKDAYSDASLGVEYVLSKLIGPSVQYSSDFGFVDEDYEELSKTMKIEKSFKVISTKKNRLNRDEQ